MNNSNIRRLIKNDSDKKKKQQQQRTVGPSTTTTASGSRTGNTAATTTNFSLGDEAFRWVQNLQARRTKNNPNSHRFESRRCTRGHQGWNMKRALKVSLGRGNQLVDLSLIKLGSQQDGILLFCRGKIGLKESLPPVHAWISRGMMGWRSSRVVHGSLSPPNV